jgi:hypothetical protein
MAIFNGNKSLLRIATATVDARHISGISDIVHCQFFNVVACTEAHLVNKHPVVFIQSHLESKLTGRPSLCWCAATLHCIQRPLGRGLFDKRFKNCIGSYGHKEHRLLSKPASVESNRRYVLRPDTLTRVVYKFSDEK